MKVHESALKHGVRPEDAIQAAAWPLWIEELDDDSPARQLRLGFDTRGRLLETVVLVFDSGNELVIHAPKGATSDARPAAVTYRVTLTVSQWPRRSSSLGSHPVRTGEALVSPPRDCGPALPDSPICQPHQPSAAYESIAL